MAPVTNVPKSEKEKRTAAIICKFLKLCVFYRIDWLPKAFADEILTLLSTSNGPRIDANLTEHLERQLQTFPTNLGNLAVQKYGLLDSKGTELWNLSTRLRRNDGFHSQKNNSIVVLMMRVYAFLMLDGAQNSGKGTFANAVRVMKLSLKAAKNCIGNAFHLIDWNCF